MTSMKNHVFSFFAAGTVFLSIAARGATIRVPADYATIGAAIAASNDGDEILVSSGVYSISERLLLDKAVRLKGESAQNTVIETSVVNISILRLDNPGAVAEGFTIRGARMEKTDSSGVSVSAGELRSCRITGMSAYDVWKGNSLSVRLSGAAAKMTDCLVYGNKSEYATLVPGPSVLDGAEMVRTWVYDNYSCATADAICRLSGSSTAQSKMTDCVIAFNNASQKNAGIGKTGVYSTDGTIAYGNFAARGTEGNTTVVKPDFKNPENRDFTLVGDSALAVLSDKTSVMQGGTVTFATPSGLAQGVQVRWNFGDGTVAEAISGESVSHTYAQYGSYDVILSAGGDSVTEAGYVRVYPRTVYLKSGSATPVFPYGSVESAAATLAQAYEAAGDGSVILVLPGKYSSVTREGFNKTIGDFFSYRIDKALTIRGGGASQEEVIFERKSSEPNHIVFNLFNSDAVLDNLVVQGGKQDSGSGVLGGNLIVNSGLVTNCVIRGGTSSNWNSGGGGAVLYGGTITHSVISNNVCCPLRGGAAVYNAGGVLANSLVTGNNFVTVQYIGDGGSVLNNKGTVINCTVAGNNVSVDTAGITAKGGSVVNCVIAGNSSVGEPSETVDWAGDASCFYNCLAPVQINESCFAGDPGFADAQHGNYRLSSASPAIDNGTEAFGLVPLADLDGNPRRDGNIDIGAYELDKSRLQVSFVAVSQFVIKGIDAFRCEATLAGAPDGSDIEYFWSAPASEEYVSTGRDPVFVLNDPPYGDVPVKMYAIVNGARIEPSGSGQTVTVLPAVLYVDAGQANPASPYATMETAARTIADALAIARDSMTVVVSPGRYEITSPLVVSQGITLMGSTGNPADVVVSAKGKCIVMSINNKNALVHSITLSDGYAGGNYDEGAGLRITGSGGVFSNSVITACYAKSWYRGGGGFLLSSAGGAIVNSKITGNISTYTDENGGGGGGVIYSGLLLGCLVEGNREENLDAYAGFTCSGGGGIKAGGGKIVNCTIVSNRGNAYGGVRVSASGAAELANCIISGNTLIKDLPDAQRAGNADLASYAVNCLADVSPALNDSSHYEPFGSTFPRGAEGVYSLSGRSKAVNAGTLEDIPVTERDIAGQARIKQGRIDIGAYEGVKISDGTVLMLK